VAGRFYSSNLYSSALTTYNTADTLIAIPIYAPTAITLTTLGVEVSTGGSAGLRVGCAIYSNTNSAPDALLAETGALAGDAAAFVSTAISLAVTAGTWYWLAAQIENGVTDPVLRALTQANTLSYLGYTSAGDVTHHGAWSVARTYTTSFPNPFTAGGALSTAASAPRVMVSF
jgi:hypothetical protein